MSDVDLTKESPTPAHALLPKLEPYDPKRDRETKRGQIALLLVWTLVGLVIATFVTFLLMQLICANDRALKTESIKTIVEVLLTPLVGLVGAVAGFYFGEKAG